MIANCSIFNCFARKIPILNMKTGLRPAEKAFESGLTKILGPSLLCCGRSLQAAAIIVDNKSAFNPRRSREPHEIASQKLYAYC